MLEHSSLHDFLTDVLVSPEDPLKVACALPSILGRAAQGSKPTPQDFKAIAEILGCDPLALLYAYQLAAREFQLGDCTTLGLA
jgi:hypothetical protein